MGKNIKQSIDQTLCIKPSKTTIISQNNTLRYRVQYQYQYELYKSATGQGFRPVVSNQALHEVRDCIGNWTEIKISFARLLVWVILKNLEVRKA